MKKVLVALVVVAVAVCFVGTVYSADTATTKTTTVGGTTITKEKSTTTTPEGTLKEKTKTITAGDVAVTKEKAKLTTPEATVKEKAKSVTTGDTTVTKAKEVVDYKSTNITPGDVVREKVTIKQFNVNDPKLDTDDTITIINDKKETMTWKLDKNLKRNNLKKHIDKEVVFSTYKIGPDQYVKDFEVPTAKTPLPKEVAPAKVK